MTRTFFTALLCTAALGLAAGQAQAGPNANAAGAVKPSAAPTSVSIDPVKIRAIQDPAAAAPVLMPAGEGALEAQGPAAIAKPRQDTQPVLPDGTLNRTN